MGGIGSPLSIYNPNMYDSPLKDYMIEAYHALEEQQIALYQLACAKITNELKWSWKSEIMSKEQADKIKDYFWGMM